MNDDTPATGPRSSSRPIWLIGAIVALVLMVVAAATFLLVSDDEVATYPPGSPEAAYQEYAQAWEAGDVETAWEAFTTRAQGRISKSEFRDTNTWRGEEAMRIWIEHQTGTDDRAVLNLSIDFTYDGGLFGTDRHTESSRVTLLREDGEWKIDTPLVGHYGHYGW